MRLTQRDRKALLVGLVSVAGLLAYYAATESGLTRLMSDRIDAGLLSSSLFRRPDAG